MPEEADERLHTSLVEISGWM